MNTKRKSKSARSLIRKGAVTVLAAFLSIVMLGMVAFSVDVGYILSVKEELQRTADAAAMAACWDYGKQLSEGMEPDQCADAARAMAADCAYHNVVAMTGPAVDLNPSNSASGDVVLGYVSNFNNPTLDTSQTSAYNAVRVRVRRDQTLNGDAPLFFAKIFGHTGQSLHAEATAALVRDVKGFQVPYDGGNVEILPFALDLETFEAWMAGSGDDEWTWDAEDKQIHHCPDGKLEVNLYPQDTGSPGNRGTVDIGSNNNSTNDIARQILEGVSPDDLAYHGGTLEFNHCGKLYLNGDTGISAGVKDELAAIKGQPRAIPIFSQVDGPGNNATYTIVKWMGIRILDVKLTGPMKSKHVTIQAAPLVSTGVIPSETTGTSAYVYTPVILLQ